MPPVTQMKKSSIVDSLYASKNNQFDLVAIFERSEKELSPNIVNLFSYYQNNKRYGCHGMRRNY